MKLLTKEILDKLPPLYSQENEKDPMVIAKFFYPDFSWTWCAIEFDEEELGYFTLSELQSNRGKLGLSIERDRYFKSCRLSEIKGR